MTRRHYPLAQLQKERGGEPLFHTVFNYIHFHVYQQLAGIGEMTLTGGSFFEETNFELSTIFGVDPTGSRMMITLEYDSAVFAAAQMDAMGRAYLEALEAMARDVDAPQQSTPLLAAERAEMTARWNDTAAARTHDCAHRVFERSVGR